MALEKPGIDSGGNEYFSKRDKSLAILKATGMWRSNYEPPYLRVLWRFGLDIRPPHFVPFFQILIFAAAWFAIAWGTFMWISTWSSQGPVGMSLVGRACGAGLFFGFFMAVYYAYGRRKYQLPKWTSI